MFFQANAARYGATFAGRHSARTKKAASARIAGPPRGALLDVVTGGYKGFKHGLLRHPLIGLYFNPDFHPGLSAISP